MSEGDDEAVAVNVLDVVWVGECDSVGVLECVYSRVIDGVRESAVGEGDSEPDSVGDSVSEVVNDGVEDGDPVNDGVMVPVNEVDLLQDVDFVLVSDADSVITRRSMLTTCQERDQYVADYQGVCWV